MSAPRPAPLASHPEKRRHARNDVIGSQLLSVDVNSRQASALILDVSESGMALQLVTPLKSRSEGTFSFLPPGGAARVQLTGVPVWSRGDRVGIRFTHLDQRMRSALKAWIASFPPEKDPLPVPAGEPDELPPLTGDSFAPGEIFGPEHATSPLPPPVEPPQMAPSPVTPAQESLDSMVSRARILLCGTGAAVAWVDANGMVCRASDGNAPPRGVPVDSTRGLSGECVRTGAVVRCDDTESDPRVDPEVCRQLNLRSAIIVPIATDSGILGLLEVFSNKPRAFSEKDVPTLRTLASQFRPAQEPSRKPPTAVRLPEPQRRPVAALHPPRTMRQEPTARAPRLQDVELVREKLSHSAEPPKKVGSPKLAIVALVISGGVLGGSLFLYRNKISGSGSSSPQTASVAKSEAKGIELPSPTEPATAGTGSRREKRTAPSRRTNSSRTATAGPRSDSPGPQRNSEQDSPLPAETAARLTAGGGTESDESGLLASLPSGAVPVPKLTAEQDTTRVTELKLVHQVAPKYPKAALLEKRGGIVVLRLSVGSNGRVKDARYVSGDEEFVASALDAVRQWRYEPYRLNGKPVDVSTEAIITFSMTSKSGQ